MPPSDAITDNVLPPPVHPAVAALFHGDSASGVERPPTAPEQPSAGNPAASAVAIRQFVTLWHPLLAEIAAAENRDAAAVRLVAQFVEMLPDHIIRFGWGVVDEDTSGKRVRRLHRLLDSRLGWLGPENSIHDSLKQDFEKHAPAANNSAEQTAAPIRWEAANLIFELTPRAATTEGVAPRCQGQIWIRTPQTDGDELQRFSQLVPPELLSTLASVFFSRPATSKFAKLGGVVARWWSRRGTIGIVVLLLILIACVPVQYRIPAAATVTAMNSRRVAAPIDGTLLVAHVRPGDRVAAGDPLLELDGRPLRIELEAISSEIAQATKDEDIALASGQIAQSQLAGLKRQTLSRRRDLITSRLERLIVTSPIDGVVIQGDLQHSLGSPLEIGKTLLEIAPAGSIEIELEIPEVEIGFVKTSTPVELWFLAVGRDKFYTRVSTIWPSATIREDENVFVAKTPMPTTSAPPSELEPSQVANQNQLHSPASTTTQMLAQVPDDQTTSL